MGQFIFTEFVDRHLVLLRRIASWTSGLRSWENWLDGLLVMKGKGWGNSVQLAP